MPSHFSYTLILALCISVFLGRADVAMADTRCAVPAFLVEGVEVAAESVSGDAARQIAMDRGLEKSWLKLKARLLLEGQSILGDTNIEEVSNLVDYTRLVRETVLPKRYLAEFDYCYDRDLVRAYFAEKGLLHAELISGRMLVLPVWNTPGQPRIWRQPNHWFDAWKEQLGTHDGLVMLALPANLATERRIDAASIARGDAEMIAAAARLEHAERVIITTITPGIAESADGQALSMKATARLYNRSGQLESEFYTLNEMTLPGSQADKTMKWLAGEMIGNIENVWRKTNVLAREPIFSLPVFVSMNKVENWAATLKTLESLAPVHSLSILHLSAEGGLVRVNMNSSMQSLSYALESAGLMLQSATDAAGNERLHLLPLDR